MESCSPNKKEDQLDIEVLKIQKMLLINSGKTLLTKLTGPLDKVFPAIEEFRNILDMVSDEE